MEGFFVMANFIFFSIFRGYFVILVIASNSKSMKYLQFLKKKKKKKKTIPSNIFGL